MKQGKRPNASTVIKSLLIHLIYNKVVRFSIILLQASWMTNTYIASYLNHLKINSEEKWDLFEYHEDFT